MNSDEILNEADLKFTFRNTKCWLRIHDFELKKQSIGEGSMPQTRVEGKVEGT